MRTIYLSVIAFVVSLGLVGCGAGDGDVDCGAGLKIELSDGPVCVYSGGLLIETGFSCPADLDYRHQYGEYAVCSNGPELGDEFVDALADVVPAESLPGGACTNIICQLGQSCVDGHCVTDDPIGCLGDACEHGATDRDGDGVLDLQDNCPEQPNADQRDADTDGIGDVCDSPSDTDLDGVYDRFDNCPRIANDDQIDTDLDGVGDACDSCSSADGDADGLSTCDELSLGTDPTRPDTDGDSLSDGEEVLAGLDPLSVDTDLDGLGDATELEYGLDPRVASTFKDGVSDGLREFIRTCEQNTSLINVTLPGSAGLRAALPIDTSIQAHTTGPNGDDQSSFWTFEASDWRVHGFVARAPSGSVSIADRFEATFGAGVVSAYTSTDGRTVVRVHGVAPAGSNLAVARNALLHTATNPGDSPLGLPTTGAPATDVVASLVAIDDGAELAIFGAVLDRATSLGPSTDWLNHLVSADSLVGPGSPEPVCESVGRVATDYRPIDVLILIDDALSASDATAFRSLLPTLYQRLHDGNDNVRIGVVPLTATHLPTNVWHGSLGDVATASENVIHCASCGTEGGVADVERAVMGLLSSSAGPTQRIRSNAVLSVIVVSDRQPAEFGTPNGSGIVNDFVASWRQQFTVDVFGTHDICGHTDNLWSSIAHRMGGDVGALCDDEGHAVMDDLAVRLVALASPFEMPANRVSHSMTYFVDGRPLQADRTDGFVLRPDLGRVAFFGPSRPTVSDLAIGERGSVVTRRYDVVQ